VNISKTKKDMPKENAILLYSEKPFKHSAIIFYFVGSLSGESPEVLFARKHS